MKEGSELENIHIYVDSMTEEAFNETGVDGLSRLELAHLGQIFRSSDGRDIFESLTNIHIGGKEDMKKMFIAANKGEIDLHKILKDENLAKYSERKSPFGLD